MKIRNLRLVLVAIALLGIGSVSQVAGQPPDGGNNFNDRPDRGSFIARELGLSQQQQVMIRRIKRQQRLLLRAAQARLREARAVADAAIYTDKFNRADAEEKIRNVAVAQAEITKIRLLSEVAVRNVLSPEQLVKFRGIREKAQQQQRQRRQRAKDALPRRDSDRPPEPDPPFPAP